ncbi:terminase [Micromonospora krabiensis]|uniref:Phage terminase-like protein, large subunit, contains N-terminal HTH domain n=1 Tax=Micromonospora krabiensis TaxID=307121 RepID=A0A1C3N5R6_9ACTN|nr:terminase [Micromonospora krabiensis]SBV27924.1 Phage terminase-like protein, large subunit, contains N-terminal HTH domain [Micromonospora krabiensis]
MATATLSAEEIDALEPYYFGLTWKHKAGCFGRLEDHPGCEWELPELTLGWQIVAWCTKYLNGLDGGHWTFTPEQLRWILWWYAVDQDGEFVYRTGVFQRLKGHGKDPLAAVMCLIEFVGPSRFSHFDAEGVPVGKANRRSWVQIAAVSRDQTKNTMTLFPSLMSDLLIQTYGIKAGAEIIRAHRGRCRIEAVTSNYRSLEGGRSSFVIMNETHHWVRGNSGDKMYETIDGNATKMNCRYLAITNAYLPGEDSVAEKMRFAWELIQEGRAEDIGFLYDSIEAHEKTPLTPDALRIVIPKIRGDATWLRVDAIIKSVQNTSITAARSRRMWLNMIVADEEALYGPDQLRAIVRDGATLTPGDEIVLGFDGGRYEDSTALVAIRLKDRVSFLLGLWEQPHTWDTEKRGRWQVDAQAVDSTVRSTFSKFKVKAFFADVNLWESYITDWTNDLGSGLAVKARQDAAIAFDMRNRQQETTRAHERLISSIVEGKVFFDGDLSLRRHTMNARRFVNNFGQYFRKESQDSNRRIDAYAAWMLAHEALHRCLTNPKQERTGSGDGWFL